MKGTLMAGVKKIVLIISASNFERHKNIIEAIHQTLKEMGNFALYVLTSYGIYTKMSLYDNGEIAIYELLEKYHFDGCILEGNLIGNQQVLKGMAQLLKKQEIPFVSMNFETPDNPSLYTNSYEAAKELLKHLIEVHNCSKINVVVDKEKDILSMQILKAYQETLEDYGLSVEEKRIVYQTISVEGGRELYQIFQEKKADDAQAVVCLHDICSIGFCLELEKQGYHVPEDILLCSLNRSTNSMIFRPDITGADRQDKEMAQKACYLLWDKMQGKQVPLETSIEAKIYYGQSCGCENTQSSQITMQYQELILSKVEAANQIRQMMQYNDAMEEVSSLEELGENIKNMFEGIHCREFLCCLNQEDLRYIMDEEKKKDTTEKSNFDNTMLVISGATDRTGNLFNQSFPLSQLIPFTEKAGDFFLFLPIHHREHVYGYMVFVNEYLPIRLYNYRICHESIGSSIENLHRQMILKSSIKELNELHMRDALTGLYNRFALKYFQEKYFNSEYYIVVMIDMDGLKVINDKFGHLAGNHAICIVADAIRESVYKEDLVIRYGGDEFFVLSNLGDASYWELKKIQLNEKLEDYAKQEKLPYYLGVSMGYAISNKEQALPFEEYCERADKAMYEHKRMRKKIREEKSH